MASVLPGQDILGLAGSIPEEEWGIQDDLCDCVFQRIAWFTNPYIGRTMEVRLCCVWAEILKDYPQFIREIPGYDVQNVDVKTYDPKPMEWNGEDDMPRAIWNRQLAVQMGLPIETVRNMTRDEEPPKGIKRTRYVDVPFLIASENGSIKEEVFLEVEQRS